MIFSSNQIKALSDFNLGDRHQILTLAFAFLTVPQKLILNLIKLALLIPPFIYLARQDWGLMTFTTIVVLLCYLMIMKPLSLYFCCQHLDKAIKQFKAHN